MISCNINRWLTFKSKFVKSVYSRYVGSVELIDVGDRLPGLKYVPGVSHWTVTNRELQVISSPDAIPEKNKSAIKKTMFPPSAIDAPKYNLHRWYGHIVFFLVKIVLFISHYSPPLLSLSVWSF